MEVPLRFSNPEKKAEIARDLAVAYISHVNPEHLREIDEVCRAIEKLFDTIDRVLEVAEPRPMGLPTVRKD